MPIPSFAVEAPECAMEANNWVCPQSCLHLQKRPKYPEEKEELLAGLKIFSYITGNHLTDNAYEKNLSSPSYSFPDDAYYSCTRKVV